MYIKIFLAFIFFCINTFSYADETSIIKIVNISTLPDGAPFCIADPRYPTYQTVSLGENAEGFNGYSWEIVKESFQEMGYRIRLSIMPWPRVINSFKRGETDMIFPASKNKERKKIFNYSKRPVGRSNISVYVLPSSKAIWKDLSSLNEMTIGAKRGFNYGDKWNEAIQIKKHQVATISQGFKMLSLNRFDGYICYDLICDYMLKQKGDDSKYHKLPVFDILDDYVLTLKANPKGEKLLKDFDTGFKRIIENGTFATIKSKWFGT